MTSETTSTSVPQPTSEVDLDDERLSLLAPEFDPSTNPDVQEALSKKYGNEVVMLLALKSGSIAVFNRAFDLKAIIDPKVEGEFDWEAIQTFGRNFYTELTHRRQHREAAKFFGEPDDRDLARDIKNAHRPSSGPKDGQKTSVDVNSLTF